MMFPYRAAGRRCCSLYYASGPSHWAAKKWEDGKARPMAYSCPAQDGLLYGEDATQPGPIF